MSEQHRMALIEPLEHAGHDTDLAARRRILRRTVVITCLALVGLGVGASRTVMSRVENAKSLEAGAVEYQKTYVNVATPRAADSSQQVVLPATLQGFVQSPIAARTAGYLRRWHKDIGARVQQGELLAEIEAPEIDQQLSQAIAAREQAAASLALAKSTADRWEALRKRDAVSQQELDERKGNEAQARANLAAAEANVERLRQLEGFKRVTAPFAGVITRRNVDTGDLIDAGGNRPLFVLTQTDPLRVYVNVPQAYVNKVKVGQEVKITQAELSGEVFTGRVARMAAAIDAQTRTMQVEVSLPNRAGKLFPGAFVQVALPIPATEAITISTNTLMFRREGIRVALVDGTGKVTLTPVKIGRNFGPSVEVLEGIRPTDRVVLNPSDSIATGDVVQIAPPRNPKGGEGKGGEGKGGEGKAGDSKSGDSKSGDGKGQVAKGEAARK